MFLAISKDWALGEALQNGTVERLRSAKDAQWSPGGARQPSPEKHGTSSKSLLYELQLLRKALLESFENAFDAMERNMKRELHFQPRHHREGEAVDCDSDSESPTAAEVHMSNGKQVRNSVFSYFGDLDNQEDSSDHSFPTTMQHQLTVVDGKRTGCAVAAGNEDWDKFASRFKDMNPDGSPRGCFARFFASLRAVTEHKYFEITFAVLIMMQTLAMAIEFQYNSLDVCFNIGYPNCESTKEQLWPGADLALWTIEMAFGMLFTMEVCLKLLGQHMYFFRGGWNLLDFFIILGWFITTLSDTELVMNPMLVRLGRVLRLLRFLRLVKTVQMFDVLQLLIGSLRASGMILLWSAVLLAVVMVCAALLSHSIMLVYIQDESLDMETRHEAYMMFGSFVRAFVTMYQMTFSLDNSASGLCFELSEWFAVPLLMYQGLVSFAVIKVIEAVFLNETIKLAASNDDLMIMEKNRWEALHEEKVHALFREADESGDGLIDYSEFMMIMSDERVATWLDAMEVEISDPKLVWELLCGFSGMHGGSSDRLNVHYFVKGFGRLKGSAKSLDTLKMLRELEVLSTKLQILDERLRPS
eukprot:TRINITY_DN4923_c0_g2_i2.p1 TRINITY_DN4923_c0_g2~~TRINITY_DN4923_c0_g2_i2.p1  ORF type:complete len:586 (-),score=129.42 TRINITY_DN4923_c0_g2_i2:124-1881(-)